MWIWRLNHDPFWCIIVEWEAPGQEKLVALPAAHPLLVAQHMGPSARRAVLALSAMCQDYVEIWTGILESNDKWRVKTTESWRLESLEWLEPWKWGLNMSHKMINSPSRCLGLFFFPLAHLNLSLGSSNQAFLLDHVYMFIWVWLIATSCN